MSTKTASKTASFLSRNVKPAVPSHIVPKKKLVSKFTIPEDKPVIINKSTLKSSIPKPVPLKKVTKVSESKAKVTSKMTKVEPKITKVTTKVEPKI